MALTRNALLWAAQNATLQKRLPRLRFVRRAVRKFMPGENLDDGLRTATAFAERGLPTTFTELGENVHTEEQANAEVDHYLSAYDRIAEAGLDTEISVKLTHLGLDLTAGLAVRNSQRLAERAAERSNWLWIDMEGSPYVQGTVDTYRALRAGHPNVGICLQAYLHRTDRDIEDLLPLGPSIRLVKGAYREPSDVAIHGRRDIADAFARQALQAIGPIRERGGRLALATHDVDLIHRIDRDAAAAGFDRAADYEVHMLYGIRQADQFDLLSKGFRVRCLIAYGEHWYPWYMRRLAEKPSNVWFVLRNLVSRTHAS
jgi:proline dehydrogenase